MSLPPRSGTEPCKLAATTSFTAGPGMSGWARSGRSFLFWLLWRVALKRGETMLARFALAMFSYGVFQQAVAMIVLEDSRAGAADAHAADALSASHLLLPDACRRVSAGQVSAEDRVPGAGRLSCSSSTPACLPRSALSSAAASTSSCPEGSQLIRGCSRSPGFATNTPIDAYFAMDPNYLAAHQARTITAFAHSPSVANWPTWSRTPPL